ncbi:hypothetical protein LEMLEM_LOCUS7145 [Lemmus lemmus]
MKIQEKVCGGENNGGEDGSRKSTWHLIS